MSDISDIKKLVDKRNELILKQESILKKITASKRLSLKLGKKLENPNCYEKSKLFAEKEDLDKYILRLEATKLIVNTRQKEVEIEIKNIEKK